MQALTSSKCKSCVELATKVIGDKWTPLLISSLSGGTLRFHELQERVSGLNPRTLSSRLAFLDTVGIIDKKIYPTVPPKVEYTLTEKGRDLLPILRSMVTWGDKYSKSKVNA